MTGSQRRLLRPVPLGFDERVFGFLKLAFGLHELVFGFLELVFDVEKDLMQIGSIVFGLKPRS